MSYRDLFGLQPGQYGEMFSPGHSGAPYLSLPAGWDAAWRSAKAACASTPAWITFLGDSIMQGVSTSDSCTKRYPFLLRQYLANSFPLYAEHWPVQDTSIYDGGSPTGTLPWSHNTPANVSIVWADYFYNKVIGWYGTGTNVPNLSTFVTPYACTSLDILYVDYTVGTWTYSIDGGPNVTVTCTGNATIAGTFLKKATVSGLANTTHTITFGNASVEYVLQLAGVNTCYNTHGLGFGYLGASSQSMHVLAESSAAPVDKLRLWQGMIPQGDGTPTEATGFGFPTQPSLMVIGLGTNDNFMQYGTSDVQTGLVRVIQAARRGVDNCSVLLVSHCYPDALNSDITSGWAHSDTWYQYLDIVQRVAAQYNCGWANIHAKWGEYPLAKGFVQATNSHPTDAGHNDIYTLLVGLI